MIISASRRTDIPAFYPDWLCNRVKEGFVLVRNPVKMHQVTKINLSPETVDCIVFWTKNPASFLNKLSWLKSYHYYFQYTITGYGKIFEPNVPSLNESISTFIKLSGLLGKNRVVWRYDPVIITPEWTVNNHIRNFNTIADQFSGYTNKCVISFVDYYKKIMKNLAPIVHYQITNEQIAEIAYTFSLTGARNGLEIVCCAEEVDLSEYKIFHGKCIDDKLIEEISGVKLNIGKDKNQRSACGCVESIDIGEYNSCPHGCLYCYANSNMDKVRENYSEYSPASELQFGQLTDEDVVFEKNITGHKQLQPVLFKDDIP
jgi:hypothetical protein